MVKKSLGILVYAFNRAKQPVHSLLVLSIIFGFMAVTFLPQIANALVSSQPIMQDTYSGSYSPNTAPPSATIAASPNKEIELTNANYKIMNRSGSGKSGPINDLIGGSNVFLTIDINDVVDYLSKDLAYTTEHKEPQTGHLVVGSGCMVRFLAASIEPKTFYVKPHIKEIPQNLVDEFFRLNPLFTSIKFPDDRDI